MPLTDKEQAECLRFLGYANWETVASSFQLGYPSPSQPEFLVRDAFARIDEQGIELIRVDLQALRNIECQMMDTTRLKASKLGDMTLNGNEFGDLRQRQAYWVHKLEEDLGAYYNPLSEGGAMAGGRNAKVIC